MNGRRKPITGRLLLFGFLVGFIGLIGAAVAGSAADLSYEVRVTEPSAAGKVPACKSTVLFVDSRTGSELPCSGTPVEGFTPADRQEILKLATELAADGQIDSVDEFKLTERAAEIGRRHNDTSGNAIPLLFRVIAILGGVAFATGIAFKLAATLRRSAPRR